MRVPYRRILIWSVVLIALVALAYHARGMVHGGHFSWKRLVQSVREAKFSGLLLGLITIYVAYFIRAIRWKCFSHHIGPSSLMGIYRSTIIGFAAVFVLGRAGEPVRPLLIARKEKMPVSSMFGIYVLERLFDVCATAVLAGISLLFFPEMMSLSGANPAGEARARTAGLFLLAGLVAAVGFLVYFRLHGAGALARRLKTWHARGGWRVKVATAFAGFSDGLQAIRSFSDLGEAVFYTAAHWAVIALAYFLVIRSFGGDLAQIDFPGAMLVLAFTMVGSALQIPGVGGGSQIASFIAFTSIFGIDTEPALAASLVLWLITFAASSLVGIPLAIHEGWSMDELRDLAHAESKAEAAGKHVSTAKLSHSPRTTAKSTGDSRR